MNSSDAHDADGASPSPVASDRSSASTLPAMYRTPHQVDVLADAVAAELSGVSTDVVVSWFNAEDTVVAHVIADKLGASRAVVHEDMGILSIEPSLAPNSRILIVGSSSSFSEIRTEEALRTVLGNENHVVAGIAKIDSGEGLHFEFHRG